MNPVRSLAAAAAFAGAVLPAILLAETAPDEPAPESTSDEDVVIMSPFTVDATRDRGYRATNSISGTRLNTAIKDLPMPIEVITEEFMRDTGARNLRESLRYSSGVMLQTQNDYSAPAGSFSTSPGKINNPEGMTSSATGTNMKIRGFQTESVLRDGFRRQNATDAVNIDRVEVARGPASLLYGVGNFGGVVNYLVKQPKRTPEAELSFAYGSDDFLRATFDTTGPLAKSGTVAYRLTGAWQDTGSYTDFNEENHYFVSPIVSWRPFEGTEVVFDVEYGEQENTGIGWQTLRAVASGYVNDSAGYNGDFYQIPGKDVREFRWSGPDTYRENEAANFVVKLTQKITDNLHFMVGASHSTFSYEQLDNLAHFRTVAEGDGTPAWAVAPVTYAGLSSTQTGVPVGPQPSTIGYQWERRDQDDEHDQIRAELNFAGEMFQDASKWVRMKHSILAGYSYTDETAEYHTRQTPGDVVNLHSPADYSYFRFGQQGNGMPDYQLVEWDNQETTVTNKAVYGVYQGRLLDDRLTVIAGVRYDESWNSVWQYNPQFRLDGTRGGDAAPFDTRSDTNEDTTYQWGLNLAITPKKDLSVYVMRSEGVQPNYQGKVDLYGKPVQAAIATNEEIGLKFDLFGGRLSGTISKFKITRERGQVGSSSLVWFAPVVTDNLRFDPNKDIVYRVDDLNPVTNDWNGAIVASTPQWDAARAAGAVYQATNSGGETHWYANASQPAGAALLDAVFANVHALKQYGWWGWIYGGADPGSLPFDNLVNNATMDDNGAQRAVATGSDRSEGWDTQMIWSPTDNLQIVGTWSHIEKQVLNAQAWPKYPYPQDRWTIWYAPISFAATAGRPLNEVYTDPTDTSTYIAFGTGLPMDDTPENHATLWMSYKFTNDALKGWTVGVGGWWEDERSIYPAYGQNALDNQGNPIFLSTQERTSINAMIRYDFEFYGRGSSIQLNVDNVTNDRDLYGFIYSAPLRWQLTFSHQL